MGQAHNWRLTRGSLSKSLRFPVPHGRGDSPRPTAKKDGRLWHGRTRRCAAAPQPAPGFLPPQNGGEPSDCGGPGGRSRRTASRGGAVPAPRSLWQALPPAHHLQKPRQGQSPRAPIRGLAEHSGWGSARLERVPGQARPARPVLAPFEGVDPIQGAGDSLGARGKRSLGSSTGVCGSRGARGRGRAWESPAGIPSCAPCSGIVPVASGSSVAMMRKAWRTDGARGHTAPAQRCGRVGLRDTQHCRAPHRGRREGNSGPKTKRGGGGGSRVGNIRVIRCRFNPGHARLLRPITVRPGRARGLARRGLARRAGGPGPGRAGPGLVLAACGAKGQASGGTCGPGCSCRGRAAGPASASLPAWGGLRVSRGPPPEVPVRCGPSSPRRPGHRRALREAVPAPRGACPGAGGRAPGCPVQASEADPAPARGPREQRPSAEASGAGPCRGCSGRSYSAGRASRAVAARLLLLFSSRLW